MGEKQLIEMSDDSFRRMGGKYSREDATQRCPSCGMILLPREVANGFIPRRCSCEIKAKLEQDEKRGNSGFHRFNQVGAVSLSPAAYKLMKAVPTEAEATWTCATCGVQKPLVYTNGYVRNQCACMRARMEEESRERLREAQRKIDLENRKRSCARCFTWLNENPGKLKECTFANYAPGYFPEAFASMKALVEVYNPAYPTQKKAKNRQLLGTAGTGKTHLMAAAANQLVEWNVPCRFMTSGGLFEALGASMNAHRDTGPILEDACKTEVLFIDDIEKVYRKRILDGTDEDNEERFQVSTFFAILDARYKANLVTVISSNRMDLTPYVGRYGYSRLRERLQTLEMIGDDYRDIKLLIEGKDDDWV